MQVSGHPPCNQIYNSLFLCSILLVSPQITAVVEEKVNNIRSKLEHRIEAVENKVTQHSRKLKRQKDRIESNTKEIECLSKKVKTEHQYKQKENYSEFSKNKGINFLVKKIKYTIIDFTIIRFYPISWFPC